MRHTKSYRNNGESGQAIVESAIVLPMYVFLMLGILQLGMMHQAQLLTKYAAYRAVRAGSLHNANVLEMEKAATQVILPKYAMLAGGNIHMQTVQNAEQLKDKMSLASVYHMANPLPPTRVTICGPIRDHFPGIGEPEVDFDDIQATGGGSWENYSRMKLRIQVLFNYRMPIPFANDIIARIVLGQQFARAMRMDKEGLDLGRNLMELDVDRMDDLAPYIAAYNTDDMIVPIRASYSMRMMSNIHLDNLPNSNECVLSFDPIEGRDKWNM